MWPWTLTLNSVVKQFREKYNLIFKTEIKAKRTINLFSNKIKDDAAVSQYIPKVIPNNPYILKRYYQLYPGEDNLKYGLFGISKTFDIYQLYSFSFL